MNQPASENAYERIRGDLRRRIDGGEWNIGAMLPGLRTFATEYEVSLGTVQRAVGSLLEDGILTTSDRRGTFVARRPQTVADTAAAAGGPGLKNKTIGIIATTSFFVDEAAGEPLPWTTIVTRAIERRASRYQARTKFFNVIRWPDKFPTPAAAIDAAVEQGMDALVVICVDSVGWTDQVLAAYNRISVPLAYITTESLRHPLPHVFYDQYNAGYQAARHLLDSGYRQLILFRPFAAAWAEERMAGAEAAVRQAGLADATVQVVPPATDTEFHAFTKSKKLQQAALAQIDWDAVRADRGLYAIVAPNDPQALLVREELLKQELAPGADVGLIGFDGDPQAAGFGLSTMVPPMEGLGEAAARLVAEVLSGEAAVTQIRLSSDLVARASTLR